MFGRVFLFHSYFNTQPKHHRTVFLHEMDFLLGLILGKWGRPLDFIWSEGFRWSCPIWYCLGPQNSEFLIDPLFDGPYRFLHRLYDQYYSWMVRIFATCKHIKKAFLLIKKKKKKRGAFLHFSHLFVWLGRTLVYVSPLLLQMIRII